VLPIAEVQEYAESLIAMGVTEARELEAAVVERFRAEVDAEKAVDSVCRRMLSLAVARMKNADGERLAFPVKDATGTRRIAHALHTTEHGVWIELAKHHAKKAREHQVLSTWAYQHATQFNMFTGKTEAQS
jgi:hypothetical protein